MKNYHNQPASIFRTDSTNFSLSPILIYTFHSNQPDIVGMDSAWLIAALSLSSLLISILHILCCMIFGHIILSYTCTNTYSAPLIIIAMLFHTCYLIIAIVCHSNCKFQFSSLIDLHHIQFIFHIQFKLRSLQTIATPIAIAVE